MRHDAQLRAAARARHEEPRLPPFQVAEHFRLPSHLKAVEEAQAEGKEIRDLVPAHTALGASRSAMQFTRDELATKGAR